MSVNEGGGIILPIAVDGEVDGAYISLPATSSCKNPGGTMNGVSVWCSSTAEIKTGYISKE